MNRMISIAALVCTCAVFLPGCKPSFSEKETESAAKAKPEAKEAPKAEHVHDDGTTHAAEDHGGAEDHAHDEVSIGTVTIGDMSVELAQGHGKVEAGKEGHLVVKLPYNDKGATVIRAWIGTEDRLQSIVGKGDYAPSHDDYDIHAVAPDPLPESAMWWVEITKPDGKKSIGSAKPLM